MLLLRLQAASHVLPQTPRRKHMLSQLLPPTRNTTTRQSTNEGRSDETLLNVENQSGPAAPFKDAATREARNVTQNVTQHTRHKHSARLVAPEPVTIQPLLHSTASGSGTTWLARLDGLGSSTGSRRGCCAAEGQLRAGGGGRRGGENGQPPRPCVTAAENE